MPRKYDQKARADKQADTRQRIIETTVALHQEVGGEAATISLIAERAGVGRPTIYRHFPDERALLTACTGHYLSLNPPTQSGRVDGVDGSIRSTPQRR